MGLSVENEEGACEVTEVGKVEGEASINNRKGKLIFFYEWTLKATWTGTWHTPTCHRCETIHLPLLFMSNYTPALNIVGHEQ